MVLRQAQDWLDWKIVETFYGSYKLNCDQLVDMHHTQK